LIRIIRSKVREQKYSKMVINMMENGEMIKLMARVNIGQQMEISMRATGKMTKHKDMVF